MKASMDSSSHEDDVINETALKALIPGAVKLNARKPRKPYKQMIHLRLD